MENNKVKNLNLNKKIPQKIKLIKVGVAMLIVACSFSFLVACGAKEPVVNPVSNDQVEYTIQYSVEDNDTVSEIANMFFDDECKEVYSCLSTYMYEISKKNGLKNYRIETGNTLDIPVIISKDNEYYLRILELENQINEIEKNNLWVEHIVRSGESLSYYAALASINYEETLENTTQIRKKNNLKGNGIKVGDIILIMNPELGNLKIELADTIIRLRNSLLENGKIK